MLLGPNGRPVSTAPAPYGTGGDPVYQEIGSIGGGRDVTRGYVQEILDPLADTVLADRTATLAKYRRVHSDWQVMSTYQQRRTALIAREWTVTPGGTGKNDVAAADFLREQLEGLGSDFDKGVPDPRAPTGWDSKVDKMHFGIYYGYGVGELMLVRDGRHVALDDIRVRDRERFRFGADGTLRLLTREHMTNGEVMPSRKFWVYSAGADHDDDPYGVGLAHYLYWPVWFKRHGMAAAMKYLERLAQPIPYGKYAPGTGVPEQRKLLDTLRAMLSDSGVIFPDGMDVGYLESKRSASGDYVSHDERMDAAISKINLGQTMTTDAASTGLGSTQGDVHERVAENVQRTDGFLLMGSFNAGPAQWLTGWNYPGAAPPTVAYSFDEPEDLSALADRDHKLHQTGWRRTDEAQLETYGEGWERVEPPAPVVVPVAQAGATTDGDGVPEATKTVGRPSAEFAEGRAGGGAWDPGQTPAALAERALAEAGVDGMMGPVVELLGRATSLAEFRDGLFDLYGRMDAAEFAGVLERALLTAELGGRYEVSREGDPDA